MTSPTKTYRPFGDGVSRRDFLSGVPVALTGAALACREVPEFQAEIDRAGETDYPPLRTGMRGSHEGSFEVAHEFAHEGREWTATDTGEAYDLVVVGAGISGLAAAHYFAKQAGPDARILILDNHDDFGGHAKRNEFRLDGRTYLMNGGTLNVEAPSQYGEIAEGLPKAPQRVDAYSAATLLLAFQYASDVLRPGQSDTPGVGFDDGDDLVGNTADEDICQDQPPISG